MSQQHCRKNYAEHIAVESDVPVHGLLLDFEGNSHEGSVSDEVL